MSGTPYTLAPPTSKEFRIAGRAAVDPPRPARLRGGLAPLLRHPSRGAPRASRRRRRRALGQPHLHLVARLVAARDPPRREPLLLARDLRPHRDQPRAGDLG